MLVSSCLLDLLHLVSRLSVKLAGANAHKIDNRQGEVAPPIVSRRGQRRSGGARGSAGEVPAGRLLILVAEVIIQQP